MDQKGYKSIKQTLYYLVITGIVFISIVLTTYKAYMVKEFYESEKVQTKINIENTAMQYIHDWELIYTLVEDNLQEDMEQIAQTVINRYQEESSWEFDLESCIKENNSFEIYLIDTNNTIFKTTDTKSFNLNFNQWDTMNTILDKIRTEGISYSQGISSSAIDGSVRSYYYKPTKDGRYVVEVGLNLNKLVEKLGKKDFNVFVDELIKNNKMLRDLRYYDRFGTEYSFGVENTLTNFNTMIEQENKIYFTQALDLGKKVSVKKQIKDKILTEEYIPYKRFLDGDLNEGVIKITYDFSYIYTPMWDEILRVIMISILGGILFLFLIYRKLDQLIAPVDLILTGMVQVASGKYETKIDIKTNNEFEIISNHFNHMVKEIYLHKRRVLNAYFETIKALAKAIDAKDHYTKGHCERVKDYSLAIAKEMNLSAREIEELKYGSILHDIGKIGIPETILNKEGKLTDEEFAIIKKHPVIGYEIIKDIDFLVDGKIIGLQHHERIDGKGYPSNLCGKDINILAKIVAVADSFDAMTSKRSYRESLTIEKAIEELEKGKNTQFDHEVVDAFIKIINKKSLENN